MKLVWLAAVAALAATSTPAGAEKWVQYYISGSGSYDSFEVGYDPPIWKSGQAQLQAIFYVEVDPSPEDEWRYYSDGHSFSQFNWEEGESYYYATAANGKLSLSHSLQDGDCGHTYCENWQIDLKFAPGSFDSFPDHLPHLLSGKMTYHASSHWSGFDAYGDAFRVTAQVVDQPGQSAFWVRPVPEPASWAMMLGGFGIVGGAMRARRKTAVSFG